MWTAAVTWDEELRIQSSKTTMWPGFWSSQVGTGLHRGVLEPDLHLMDQKTQPDHEVSRTPDLQSVAEVQRGWLECWLTW